ncbi:hypothetical protein [Bosea vaviloviae]|uniref:General stress protein 17M-like domain-containing protein n=1 Tax=Bosea vaviloviae TaxID=1526658 RepID=A0A1D7UB68_9HYPH|nr:hypothetical protein [Bosea vaviloviae]AOO84599.1 hypothetical protein BHK69_18575 [Bosea vaviloviae]
MRTIIRSYEHYEDARNVVVRLEQAGVAAVDVSLIGRQATGDDNAAEGAGLGGAIGGGAGFLAGLGIIALPGIGPVVAAGWLVSTLTGAAAGALAGGLIGALSDAGVEIRDAHYYTETVRRGGAIVSVRVADKSASPVEKIMNAGRPIDAESRRAAYEREGWTAFDERAGPYRPASWSDLT